MSELFRPPVRELCLPLTYMSELFLPPVRELYLPHNYKINFFVRIIIVYLIKFKLWCGIVMLLKLRILFIAIWYQQDYFCTKYDNDEHFFNINSEVISML